MLEKLTKFQRAILILILILILIDIGIFIFSFAYLTAIKKNSSCLSLLPNPPIEDVQELLKPGDTGEPEEGETPLAKLPSVISNTTGTVKEIRKDGLIISGDGFNFSDQKPRDLTLFFTIETITFESEQKVKYTGIEGLRHLKVGDFVTVSSIENIRGKTEFFVNYINKIKS